MSAFLKNLSRKIMFDFTEYHCKFSFVSTLQIYDDCSTQDTIKTNKSQEIRSILSNINYPFYHGHDYILLIKGENKDR